MKLSKFLLPALVLVAVGSAQLQASAGTSFSVGGISTGVSADITFEYVASGPNAGTVTISITNTTSAAVGGVVTGFAFNVPSNVTGITSFTAVPAGSWDDQWSPDGISPPQNTGDFDAAGLTGANINGGDPNAGIDVGDMVTFTFVFAGSGMDGLDESSFLSLISAGGEANAASFVVRFQSVGPNGDLSDVAVPGDPGDPGGPGTPVPEPSTVALLGLGALAFAWRRRRTRG